MERRWRPQAIVHGASGVAPAPAGERTQRGRLLARPRGVDGHLHASIVQRRWPSKASLFFFSFCFYLTCITTASKIRW